jgi:hypothetical protein
VWALVENPRYGFPSRGGRRSFVHGGGSVHAVVELREDASELHHLTGHYLVIATRAEQSMFRVMPFQTRNVRRAAWAKALAGPVNKLTG